MRPVIWLAFLAAVAVAELVEDPWVQEEDLEEPYNDEREEEHYVRKRREAYVEGPYEEHMRVKRRCHDEPEYRVKRSADYVRVPRQVHQYEVHELSEDGAPSSPPYEEMLAASAEHYHRVYAPASHARYHGPDVSGVPNVPVSSVFAPNPASVQFAPPSVQATVDSTPNHVNAPVQFVNPASVPVQFVAPPQVQASLSSAPNPVNVPVVAGPVLPLKQLAGDQFVAAAHHHKHAGGHATGYQQGGGHNRQAKHYNEHGGKVS